jgi:Skp family chaperone for outer membrane proteins
MLKRLVLFLSILFLVSPIAQANVKKIAVVDVQKVVNKSAQVQALKKEQEAKRKELSNFIKKAGEDINKETDSAKKKALMDKYDKQLKTKQETNLKAYKTKLEAIDKNINTTIIQHAKTMGYDMVLTKGVVLYGGDDITEAILKVVK